MEDSRPEPGPLTRTSTRFIPWSIALRAQASAVCCAANGVDFRDPVNVMPAFAQATVLPFKSVIVIIVLLKVAWIWAIPSGTFLRSLLLPRKTVSPLRLGLAQGSFRRRALYQTTSICLVSVGGDSPALDPHVIEEIELSSSQIRVGIGRFRTIEVNLVLRSAPTGQALGNLRKS